MKRLLTAGSVITFIYIVVIIFHSLKANVFNPDFRIGVVETNVSIPYSRIMFYNDDMEFVGEKNFNFGGLSASPSKPACLYNGFAYMLCKGTYYVDSDKILELNVENGNTKTYSLKQNHNNHMVVNSDYVFGVNTMIDSTISRLDKHTKEIDTLTLKNIMIDSLNIFVNTMYAFGSSENESYMFVINPYTMQLTKQIDITQYGSSQFFAIEYGDDIYFTSNTQFGKRKNNLLVKFNIASEKFTAIPLEQSEPYQIVAHNNNLYISNASYSDRKNIIVYDLISGEQKVISLQNNPQSIAISHDKLYSHDDYKLYRYDLQTFKLEKSIELGTRNENGKWFVATALFVKD